MRRLLAPLAAAVVFSAGCAGTPANDPLEPVNRAVFKFNDGLDRVLLQPVAKGYRSALPQPVRHGVGNFFGNLGEPLIAFNNLLQGKFDQSMTDVARFGTNSVFGIFGLIDVATSLGIEKHNEDFGQTLGRWGVGGGPYLVLPVLGPSTLRDGVALMVDFRANRSLEIDHIPTRNTLTALRLVDRRAALLDASRILEEAATDRYAFFRAAFLQRRQSLVYDGNPPRDEDGTGDTPSAIDDEAADAPTPIEDEPTPIENAPTPIDDPAALPGPDRTHAGGQQGYKLVVRNVAGLPVGGTSPDSPNLQLSMR